VNSTNRFLKERTLETKHGHKFVAVEFTVQKSGEIELKDVEVVLADTSGTHYLPIGFASSSINGLILFDALDIGQVQIGVGAEASFSVKREREWVNFSYSRIDSTSGEFLLLYQVSKNDKIFDLSVAKAKPIPIEVKS